MATYVEIASVTVGSGGAASMSFSSIPSTYTDLKLEISARSTSSANWTLIAINGGSDTDINMRHLLDYNGSVYSQNYSSFRAVLNGSGSTSNTFSNSEIYLPNYAGSSQKSMSGDGVAEDNSSSCSLQMAAFLWANSSAITSLTLTVDGGSNFAQYSTAYLYGIKKD